MNKEVAEKWVAALRSGEFKQRVGILRDQTAYCCLGVLCDLYSKEHEVKWEINAGRYYFMNIHGVLPGPVREWSGVKDANGRYGEGAESLSMQNDEGSSFEEIANIIEQHVEEL